ncbi:MAG: hypothetical protein E6J34_14240 [Chloroflexi bacterium]|nr:MAG: hypothetical protein E6J34_14240 [Chloroflexota bacterium]
MRCTHCFEETLENGRCTHCDASMMPQGATLSFDGKTSSKPMAGYTMSYTLMRGDTLSNGRYRLMQQIALPELQQKQGNAWSAMDMGASRRSVIIREIIVPREMAKNAAVDRIAIGIAQRMQILGQQEGFPTVVDFFSEKNMHFLVLLYPEGETLGALLKRQNGALPEPLVAEYGYQLCALLSQLADQKPPLVHGSISPESIVIDEKQQRVSLIHLPLLSPSGPFAGVNKLSPGYYAPEQMHGEVDPSSDLYSLAATLYHAVTGYDPHERLAFFHPPVRRLNPAVTPQMEAMLTRQLSLSKAQRYANPSEMQKDFEALSEYYPDASEDKPEETINNLLHLSKEQLRERSQSNALLNMGVFAAIGILLLVGVLFAILHP